jgi:hypothetical protein
MATGAPGSALYSQLRSVGFLPGRAATSFMFEIVPLNPTIQVPALADPAAWHLTAGDFDVI